MHTDLYKRIIKAKEFIDDSCSEPIDVDRIAKEAYLSSFHFIRLFRKIYNKTPHRYLTERRIDKAKELLSKPDISVTEVCFDVGFQSPGSFSSLFKGYVGYPPAVYRTERRKKIQLAKNFPERLVPDCFLIMNGINQ